MDKWGEVCGVPPRGVCHTCPHAHACAAAVSRLALGGGGALIRA